jgi:hypothetical protein
MSFGAKLQRKFIGSESDFKKGLNVGSHIGQLPSGVFRKGKINAT